MLEVARTQLQLFWALCRRQPRVTSSRPRIIAWLPDYPAGRVRESSGVIKGLSSSIGKQNSPTEPGGRVFEVITESPTLSAAWDTGLNTSPDARLTDLVCKTLDGYGVRILQSQLTEFAPCRCLAIKGQASVGQYTLWSGF
jgi:hypothetical protein